MEIIQKTIELITPIIEKENLELVDVEYIKEEDSFILRVFIDKPNGIDLTDCENITRLFSPILDEYDYIEDDYIFEVSSPGDRPFKNLRDYERNIDKIVCIKTYEKIDGNKTFIGKLLEANNTYVIINVDNKEIKINMEKISKANVDFSI